MLKQLNDHHIADEKYDFQRQHASAGRAAVNGADAKLGMATKLFRVVGPATKVGEAAALAEYVFDGPTSENGARQGEKKTARGSKSAKRPRERKSWDTPRLLRSWPWHQLFEQPLALRTRLRHDRHEITKKIRPSRPNPISVQQLCVIIFNLKN